MSAHSSTNLHRRPLPILRTALCRLFLAEGGDAEFPNFLIGDLTGGGWLSQGDSLTVRLIGTD